MIRLSDISCDRRGTAAFSTFVVLFFAGMFMSKLVHPVYFNSEGAIGGFGLAYTVMALMGYASLYVGAAVDQYGHSAVMRVGALVYASGLFLRIYPHSTGVIVLSGVLCGLGASATLVGIRPWLMAWVQEGALAKAVSFASAVKAAGSAIGMALGGLVPYVLADTLGLQLTLITAAGFVLAAALVIGKLEPSTTQTDETPPAPADRLSPTTTEANERQLTESFGEQLRTEWRTQRRLILASSGFALLSGMYIAFFIPYLPVILNDLGFELLSIGALTAAMMVARMGVDPLIGRSIEGTSGRKIGAFLVGEVGVGLATWTLIADVSVAAVVLALGLRVIMTSCSAIAEETLWLERFPRHRVGFYTGLSQSVLFLGEAIGATCAAQAYGSGGSAMLLGIAGALILINAIGMTAFMMATDTHSQTADAAATTS